MEPVKTDRVLWNEMLARLKDQFDREIILETRLSSVIQDSLGQKLFADFESVSLHVASQDSGDAWITFADNGSNARITFSGNGNRWGVYAYVNNGDATEQGLNKIIHTVSDELQRSKNVPNAGLTLEAA